MGGLGHEVEGGRFLSGRRVTVGVSSWAEGSLIPTP